MCSAVILGLKETEETYYLLVKEPKTYREASVNCRLRGGNMAMPKTSHINQLLAEYVRQAGLTRVYIGVQAQSRDSVSISSHTHSHTCCVDLGAFILNRFTLEHLLNFLFAMFLSSGWRKQLHLCRFQPPRDLPSLEPWGGAEFQSSLQFQLQLCGAAQHWSLGLCGVWRHHVFHVRVLKEQKRRRDGRRMKNDVSSVIILDNLELWHIKIQHYFIWIVNFNNYGINVIKIWNVENLCNNSFLKCPQEHKSTRHQIK